MHLYYQITMIFETFPEINLNVFPQLFLSLGPISVSHMCI
jgi:hypothetical protein